MPTVARLTQSGDLQLQGEVNEILPPIKRSMLAHLPLQEDTTAHMVDRNMLDTSLWKLGATQAVPQFLRNGQPSENQILEQDNPWGEMDLVWGAINNDVASDNDGGWNTSALPVDSTKTYRFSVWVKVVREGGEGSIYLGCAGGSVSNFSGVVNNNPYFMSGNPGLPDGEWLLLTGYVYPETATGVPTLPYPAGAYTLDGTNVYPQMTSYRWMPGITSTQHRTYLFYSTTPQIRVYFYQPRYEVVDGYEPSVPDLLNNVTQINTGMNATYTNPLFADGGAWVGKRPIQLETQMSNYQPYNNFAVPATWVKLTETYEGNPIFRISFKVTDPTRLSDFQTGYNNHGIMTNIRFTFKALTAYAHSVLWRPVNKDVRIGGIPANIGGWDLGQIKSIPLDNGWTKHIATRIDTYATEATDYMFVGMMCPDLRLDEIVYIDFTCPTLFEGEYEEMYSSQLPARPTSEVSQLKITPTNRLTPPFSVNFWHKQSNRASSVVDQGSSPVIMQMNNYYSNPSLTLWNMNGQIVCLTKGNTGTSWTTLSSGSGTNVLATRAYQAKEHMYTVVFKSTTQYEIYIDGVLRLQNTISPAISGFNELHFYDRDAARVEVVAKVRDVTVYDDALTASEVARLAQVPSALQMSSKGQLATRVNESPVAMAPKRPDDYLPLTDPEFTSAAQLVAPTETVNLVTNEMGTFVPRVQNNLLQDANLQPMNSTKFGRRGWEVHGIRTDRPYGAGDNRQYVTTVPIPVTANTIYSFQMLYWSSDGIIDDIYMQFDGTGFPEGGIYYRPFASEAVHANRCITRLIEPLGGNLYRLKVTFMTSADTTKLVCIFFDADLVGISVFGTEVAVALGRYVEYGSNGVGSLEFNLVNSLDWDWSKDWTIAYWKKPIGSTDPSSYNGYNLESFGCNSNSVGGRYLWWGKTTGATSDTFARICMGDPAVQGLNVPNEQYYDKWHLVVITGTNSGAVTVTYMSKEFGAVTFSRLLPLTTKNAMLTQYGYDFKLGGYDNDSPSSSWFKDVSFYKQKLEPEDIQLLFRRGMKQKNTSFLELGLKGQVRENTPL